MKHKKRKYPVLSADTDGYSPTKGMVAAAKRGLELRKKYGKGGTQVGVARARDIANQKRLSLDTVKRMHSFFSRHDGNQAGGENDAGYIAWLLWGGDPGRSFARKIAERESKEIQAGEPQMIEPNRKERRRLRKERRVTIRRLPGEFELNASFEIEAAEEENKQPTISIQAYDGEPMKLRGFPHPVVVDLNTAGFRGDQIVLLRDHDAKRPIGHSTTQRISATGIEIDGVLSVSNQDSNEIVAASKNGFQWQASIGARDFRAELVAKGKRVSVNNKTHYGPVIVARHAKIHEVSVLPIGAAKSTTVSIAASLNGEIDMDFTNWLEAKGFEVAALSDDQVSVLQAAYDSEKAPEEIEASEEPVASVEQPNVRDIVQQLQAEAKAENLRLSKINSLCATHGIREVEVDGAKVILAEHAINNDWSVERTELEIRRNERPVAQFAIHASGSKPTGSALEASILRSQFNFSDSKLEASFDGQTLEVADSKQYRSMGLHQMMDEIIHASGGHFNGNRKSPDFIRTAFEASNTLKASGTSTLSLPNIFENTLNKVLLDQFNSIQTSWQKLCQVVSVSDFKAINMYRLEANGGFQPVAKDGELKHMSMQDSKSTLQADTFGAIMTLTRKDIINDDLSALSQRASVIGRTAGKKIEEEVFQLLLNNTGSYYSVGGKNYASGAGTALSYGSLSDALEGFRNQVDANGQPVLIEPKYLVVPTSLEGSARELMTSQLVGFGGTDNAKSKDPTNNIYFNLAEVCVSPYLNNANIKKQGGSSMANTSASSWYLWSDPADGLAPIRVGFLNGRQEPIVEQEDMSFEKLGIQMRSYFDFGVAFSGDKQGSFKMAGA